MIFLNLWLTITMEVEKGQENRIYSIVWHYCQQSSGFKNRDFPLKSCVWWDWPYFACSSFPLTPAQGVWAGRTVQTHWSQSRAVPTRTKGWAFTLWKANREGWWEATCQGAEQILRDSGSRSSLGFLGEPLSLIGFCLQQAGSMPPANTVLEGFQTKASGCFAKLPQRLSKCC